MREWIARHGWAVWTGVALTALAILLENTHLGERLEYIGYDFNVRHFSRIPASPRILHVDLDDDAFDRVGSWPWPRDLQGELIRILHDLGAARIAVDFVWKESKPPEVRIPTLDRYSDIEGTMGQIGELSAENVVLQDDELARAIETAGNVYLSMYYEETGTSRVTSLLAEPMAKLLESDFGLTSIQLVGQLHANPQEVEDVLAGVKRQTAEKRVRQILSEKPDASLPEVHSAILKTPFDRPTADGADIRAAYQRALSLRALRDKCPRVPKSLEGKLPRMGEVTPPLYEFTTPARSAGFVFFKPDLDGNTRHVPLLADWDGRMIAQLGFAVACDELDIRPEDFSLVADRLHIAARGKRRAFSVQLDRGVSSQDEGILINWHVAPGWEKCFSHMPAAQLLRIADANHKLRDNTVQRDILFARAMRLAKNDAAYEGYRQQVNERITLARKVRVGGLQGRGQAKDIQEAQAKSEQLSRTIETDHKETAAFIEEQWAALRTETQPADAQTAAEIKRFNEAHKLLHEDVTEVDRVNTKIKAEQAQLVERLRPLVKDKLCFIGYTATAVADMINTPAYPRVPGVLVHSSVLNSFLEGQFRNWAPRWLRMLIIVALGTAVTIVTATRGPRTTAVLVVGMMVLLYVLNCMTLFYRFDVWMQLFIGLSLMFVLWAAIVLLRFLTTDRQKRQFSKAVSQYVSPAMAKRIADSVQQLDLSPVSGVVTCFFSDLAGFTQASERLGPDGTREVLNPYLETMSRVLHQHNALINKFMGDGIFAFFNPPILPCPQHERAACEAAIASIEALHDLRARYAQHPLAHEFERLHMRVGIATGPVFVGDYGSENKLDYTCVGDTVNLASRLEGANKFFGSTLMVAGSTYEAVTKEFVFRRLGRLQVKGQTVAVPVFDLLGVSGRVNGDEATYASAFETAVEAFGRRDWASSMAAFQECLARRPEDAGARRYLTMIDQYRETPPPPEWNMGIELTEK